MPIKMPLCPLRDMKKLRLKNHRDRSVAYEQARDLFLPANRPKWGLTTTPTPRMRHDWVRYLAATDTFDWSVAGKL